MILSSEFYTNTTHVFFLDRSLLVDEVGNDVTLKCQSGTNPQVQSVGMCCTIDLHDICNAFQFQIHWSISYFTYYCMISSLACHRAYVDSYMGRTNSSHN